MKFKEAFEKCQAELSKGDGDKASDTLVDQVTKMTIKDDTTTQESTSSQDDNQPKDNNGTKKPAAAADDKCGTEDSNKAETNIQYIRIIHSCVFKYRIVFDSLVHSIYRINLLPAYLLVYDIIQ